MVVTSLEWPGLRGQLQHPLCHDMDDQQCFWE
jgi:hypothetical protein